MNADITVLVHLKPEILDPQGKTIEASLEELGFEGIEGVRVGKAIRFSIEAGSEAAIRDKVDEVCRRLLSNPVIEIFEYTVEPAVPAPESGVG